MNPSIPFVRVVLSILFFLPFFTHFAEASRTPHDYVVSDSHVEALVEFQKTHPEAGGVTGVLNAQTLSALLNARHVRNGVVLGTESFLLTQDLELGDNHPEVKLLQVYLNTHGFPVAFTGPGSQGSETTWYGSATQRAVMSFQRMNGITPTGIVGPRTRALLSQGGGEKILTPLLKVSSTNPTSTESALLTLTASPPYIYPGQTTRIAWSSKKMVSCALSTGATGLKGVITSLPLTDKTVFSLTCTGINGKSITRALVVPVRTKVPSQLVMVSVDGLGSVVSKPKGILCGDDCAQSYATNTPITLVAKPRSGSKLSSWSGGCSGSSLTCSFIVKGGSKSITATFTGGTQPKEPVVPKPSSGMTVTVNADPSQVPSGSSSEITWSSKNAVSCTTSFGSSLTSGKYRTSPITSNTTYGVTCIDAHGNSFTDTVVVLLKNDVPNPQPTIPEMPTIPSFASGKIYYFDGQNGNDSNSGTSTLSPKKNIHANNFIKPGDSLLLKRGTNVELQTTLYPSDVYIGTYGNAYIVPGTTTMRATLRIQSGKKYGIGVNGGQFMMENIHMIGDPSPQTGSNAVGAVKASRIVIKNNIFDGFYNAIVFGGNDGEISGNIIRNTSNNGIFGGNNSYPAPSRYLIKDNYIDGEGTGDGISLHDGIEGSSYGKNNIIRGNVIFDVTRENAVDIQNPYDGTIIEDNTMYGTADYVVVTDDESHDNIIRNNRIYNVDRAAIWSRGNNETIVGNTIYDIRSNSGAAAVAVSGTNVKIQSNTITIPSENSRAIVSFIRRPGRDLPSGEFTQNTITNRSTQRLFGTLVENGATPATESEFIARWLINNNTYKVTDTAARNFPGNSTWDEWRVTDFAPGNTRKDQNSTYMSL